MTTMLLADGKTLGGTVSFESTDQFQESSHYKMMSGMETDITEPARQKKTELLPRGEHHKAHTVGLTLKTT